MLRAAVWQAGGNMHRGTIVAAWTGRVVAVLALLWPVFERVALIVAVRVWVVVVIETLLSGATCPSRG